jgi:hypothetical protein
MRSGDRRLMMPNQILSQPLADPPPGPGARPATPSKLSRREVFTGVWTRRFTRQRSALRRALTPKGTAGRSPGAGRDRRSARKGAQR